MNSTGTVVWYSAEKGYGWIRPDDGGEDVWAHFSQIRVDGYKVLAEGQRVEYDFIQGPKVREAANIVPI